MFIYLLTKTQFMSKKEDLFEQMAKLWNTFVDEHKKSTKVSQTNARTVVGELKKLVTEYRQASVEEAK